MRFVCLFSSYFPGNSMPGYVRYYLSALRPHCTRIIMITNDDRSLDPSDCDWLRTVDIELRYVRNEGFDFGMWQKVLPDIRCGDDGLLLCNDSCICFRPLDDTFAAIARSGGEAYGLVKSQAPTEHLQSYFLALSGKARDIAIEHIRQGAFARGTYDEVVTAGELGMSLALSSVGIPLLARFELHDAKTLNPSTQLAPALLAAGMPMLKKRLLSSAPKSVVEPYIARGWNPRPTAFSRWIVNHHAPDWIDPALVSAVTLPWKKRLQLERRIFKCLLRRWLRKLRFVS